MRWKYPLKGWIQGKWRGSLTRGSIARIQKSYPVLTGIAENPMRSKICLWVIIASLFPVLSFAQNQDKSLVLELYVKSGMEKQFGQLPSLLLAELDQLVKQGDRCWSPRPLPKARGLSRCNGPAHRARASRTCASVATSSPATLPRPPRDSGRRITRQASSSSAAVTTTEPVLIMPAFSNAIFATVSPSRSVWSRLMLVITADQRLDQVRGVEPPAHSHLQHGEIDLLPGEVQICDHRLDLELGDRPEVGLGEVVGYRLDFADEVGEASLGINRPSIWMRSRGSKT